MPATEATWRAAWTRAAARWPPAAPLVVASEILGLAFGAFLVLRRATGAITSPLPALPLVVTAASLVGWTLLIQLTWRTTRRSIAGELRSPDRFATFWVPLSTVLLFAVGCSYPGNRAIDWLVWPTAMAAVVWSSYSLRPARRSSPAKAHGPAVAEQVLQEITRVRTSDGVEAIRGTLVAEFGAGQRDAMLYVAFCPPFERLPEIEAEVADDSPAAVKVAQRLHNGTQLEVRLPKPAEEPRAVTIQLFAAEPELYDNPRDRPAV